MLLIIIINIILCLYSTLTLLFKRHEGHPARSKSCRFCLGDSDQINAR